MSAAVDFKRAHDALFSLDAGVDRHEWVRIGCAAKAAGLSFDDYHDWSFGAPNYKGKQDTLDAWDSFDFDGGVTARTLFYLAKRVGWEGPANDERFASPKRSKSPAPIAKWWRECEPASLDHPYICAKQGQATNVRVVVQELKGWGKHPEAQLKGWLAVPVFSADDSLLSIQFISPDGKQKLNAWHCSMKGIFTLGTIAADQKVYVVEGIGHAWSLHAVTGDACVVSFGAGNAATAVERVQAAGGVAIVVPDRGKEQQALTVAMRYSCAYAVLPESLPLTEDVNDLFLKSGRDSVLAVVANAVAPEPANDNIDATARDPQRRRSQQAENERLQQLPFSIMPPMLSVEDMIDDCVWITAGGQVGSLSEPGRVLAYSEFKDLTASSSSVPGDDDGKLKKPVLHAAIWRRATDRKTVITRTFHAGAPAICIDPDGSVAFNGWRPVERVQAMADVSPFLEHVEYLFVEPIERDAFLDWLAHIEQKPGELPHYGWLHIADNTGTGRNWLASLLARLWQPYVAPNVDLPALLESSFNGQLAGRILAIVDEVQEGGGENPYRHANKLKSLVNAEYRDINPKFGRQFREHNSCRWLVFSNHQNALPLNDSDRRWRVIHHDAEPRSPDTYRTLYALLHNVAFVNAVGVYLRQRDISGFNPGERPPMSKAKRSAVSATKSLMLQSAEQLVEHWPVDVITNADIAEVLSDGNATGMTSAMRRAMSDAGSIQYCSGRAVKIRGKAEKCWILRNSDEWNEAPPINIGNEAARSREEVRAKSAISVLAGIPDFTGRPF